MYHDVIKCDHMEPYSRKRHTLPTCKKWINRYNAKIGEKDRKIEELEALLAQKEKELQAAIKNSRKSRKHQKIRRKGTFDYEEARQEVLYERTLRWINCLEYSLVTNVECKYWTGFDKLTIINQAELCHTNPELLFHMRV